MRKKKVFFRDMYSKNAVPLRSFQVEFSQVPLVKTASFIERVFRACQLARHSLLERLLRVCRPVFSRNKGEHAHPSVNHPAVFQ